MSQHQHNPPQPGQQPPDCGRYVPSKEEAAQVERMEQELHGYIPKNSVGSRFQSAADRQQPVGCSDSIEAKVMHEVTRIPYHDHEVRNMEESEEIRGKETGEVVRTHSQEAGIKLGRVPK